MNWGEVIHGDIFINDGKIIRLGDCEGIIASETIDASDKVIIPGFVQSHVHLCQTLFRGTADDMSLLQWLRDRTWKLEAAHDYETAYASAWLGCMELIRSGTTCVGVMSSVQNADADAQAMFDIGIRGKFGKAMMDFRVLPPELGNLPKPFQETREQSIEESTALINKWHNKDNGRIQYLFTPRGILSTSEELLRDLKELSTKLNIGIHTHACESKTETQRVIEQRGLNEIKYLHSLGLTGEKLMLAHCIWIDDEDIEILKSTKTNVLHCPSTNLKLGSGIAPIVELLNQGIIVSLGSDGAPANNNLSAFNEMRIASLMQKGILLDPTALTADDTLRMATLNGATTLGLRDQIGSIEPGKKADLVVLNLNKPHTVPHPDLTSTIVYAANQNNVETVLVDGKIILYNGNFVNFDEQKALSDCRRSSEKLINRSQIS